MIGQEYSFLLSIISKSDISKNASIADTIVGRRENWKYEIACGQNSLNITCAEIVDNYLLTF